MIMIYHGPECGIDTAGYPLVIKKGKMVAMLPGTFLKSDGKICPAALAISARQR